MVFLGAKGGDGVTTLACNFAVSMAKESGQSTLLIDLDLPLGDAALNLGVVAEYSTINALQNAARLDSAFLSKLLVKHSSGVYVLAAPGKFPQFDASHEAIDKLITVARQDFDNVVIDMGSRLDLMSTSLFKDGSTVYLVIQAGIAGLRNSNRLISRYLPLVFPSWRLCSTAFSRAHWEWRKIRLPRLSRVRRSGRFPTTMPLCGVCNIQQSHWPWRTPHLPAHSEDGPRRLWAASVRRRASRKKFGLQSQESWSQLYVENLFFRGAANCFHT